MKIDWAAVERDYRETRTSLRKLGEQHGVSEAAIRKRAKQEGWTRIEAKVVRRAHQEVRRAAVALDAAPVTPADIAEHGKTVVARLWDELSATTANIGEIEEMIAAETAGDESGRRYDAMMKAVSLSSRAGVARNLATALKTLQEGAAPMGKKEQRQQAAQEIASGGKFAPRKTPRLVVDNAR